MSVENWTDEEYYSLEKDKEYCSASQYKQLYSLGTNTCEARFMAMLNGEWTEEKSDALIIGSLTDALFENEGNLTEYSKAHPELFSSRGATKGQIKSTYQIAFKMYERCKQDNLFMAFMSGEKQKIFTGEIEGMKFKCKLDSYLPGKAIVDLKTTRSIRKPFKIEDVGYVSFIEKYGYITQMAIYREIVRQNTGETLPCFIAAVSKEDEPDIEVIWIDDTAMDEELERVKSHIESIRLLKSGEVEPIRCECCDYCKHTKVLKKAIHYSDLIMDGTD